MPETNKVVPKDVVKDEVLKFAKRKYARRAKKGNSGRPKGSGVKKAKVGRPKGKPGRPKE